MVPGGYFKTAKYIREAVSDGLSEAGVRQETRDYIENHSFIPTFSAIGHLSPNQNWGNPLNTNLTCPTNKQTPFDSYYGTANNTEHISFNKESIDWLFKELDGIPQIPNFPIQNNSLDGDGFICENQVKTFSINDICKIPGTAIFSVVGNLQIMSSTNYSVTVKAITNLTSTGKIIADFGNGQTIEKTIWIGKPTNLQANYITGGYDNVSIGSSNSFSINPVAGATSYQWRVLPINIDDSTAPSCQSASIIGNGTTATVNWGNCIGKYEVSVLAINSCGTKSVDYKIVNVFTNSGGGGGGGNPCNNATVQIFPNPITTGTIEMNVIYPPCDDPDPLARVSISNTVNIYNFQGNKVYTNQFPSSNINISNINLTKGHYIINVFTERGQNIRKILIVE